MISCTDCIMNCSIEEFKIDKNGKCNFCQEWENEKNKFINFSERQISINLSEIKNKLLTLKNNQKYDCVIGLSGGVDSSFVVFQAWKLGLNPIVIHMDNGWNSKTSNYNINKILEKTNFDYKTLILNWNEFKELQISFLKAGVPDIELITDHAIFSFIIKFALEQKIKFIISGVNFATEHSTVPSWGWRKDDFNHIKKIHKIFGRKELVNFPKMYPFKKFYYEKVKKKIEVINILDLINYKSFQAKEILKKEFDWQDYGGKHHESFFTMFFQGYILPRKFKIDKRLLHFSCLIRNKELTRNEALELMKLTILDTQKEKQYINFFKKKLSLSDLEFEQIMKSKPRRHEDYDTNFFQNSVFRFLKKTIKKIIK